MKRTWLTLEWLHTRYYPRFSCQAGDTWTLCARAGDDLGQAAKDYFAAVTADAESFSWAGGQCAMDDVKVVYLGTDYGIASSFGKRNF